MNVILNTPLSCEKCKKKMVAGPTTTECRNEDCEMYGITYNRPTVKLRKTK